VPTYEYACTECGDHLEVVQRFSDDRLSVCGVCGGRLRKVFSPVGIVFKGSGFYRTDSRSGAVSAGVNGHGKVAADGAGSDGGSAESGGKADVGAKTESGKSGVSSGSSGDVSGNGSAASGKSGKSGQGSAKAGSSSAGTSSKVA
jgi:putative FmdB family regulatory protein